MEQGQGCKTGETVRQHARCTTERGSVRVPFFVRQRAVNAACRAFRRCDAHVAHHAIGVHVCCRHFVHAQGIVGGVRKDVGLHAPGRAPDRHYVRPRNLLAVLGSLQSSQARPRRRSHLQGVSPSGADGLDGNCHFSRILECAVGELQRHISIASRAQVVRRLLDTPSALIDGHDRSLRKLERGYVV